MGTSCEMIAQYHNQEIGIDKTHRLCSAPPSFPRTHVYVALYNFITCVGSSAHHLGQDTNILPTTRVPHLPCEESRLPSLSLLRNP